VKASTADWHGEARIKGDDFFADWRGDESFARCGIQSMNVNFEDEVLF
jgi:hypothetical protein